MYVCMYWHSVASYNAEDVAYAAHVEAVQLPILLGIYCLYLAAVQECTDDARFVHCYLGCHSQFEILPHTSWQVADGGTKESELVDNIQFVVVNGNDRWDVHVLAQHIGIFQADGESQVYAGLGEPIHERAYIRWGSRAPSSSLSVWQGWAIVHLIWCIATLRRLKSQSTCVGAARKVSPDWLQKTMTCHSFNCFSIVWGRG